MNDFILKGGHKYFKADCISCGSDRGYKRKQFVAGHCSSCAAKNREIQPMSGKNHSDTSIFRKHNHPHYNYEDRVVTEKTVKYRKYCPQCGDDMGYHRNVDGSRVCRSCQADNRRKYTPEQKRIRSSIKANIGARLRARNSGKKYTSVFSMLPYTFEQLLERLESQFMEGMTWGNYGEWEIDHIRPDSWFNYKSYNDKEFVDSWALNNLQPLWKSDNARKSNKYEG